MFPFFILNSDYRTNLFSQIHEIVFFGKGGYTFWDVYNMPIWLRKYIYTSISEFYTKEKEAFEKSSGQEKITANSKIPESAKNLPKVNVPDFVSKVKKPKK